MTSNLVSAPLAVCVSSLLVSAQAPTYTAEFLGEAINAAAMNDAGLVVGTTTIGTSARAWIAGPGMPITALPLLPGFVSSEAVDINEAGVVVGAATTLTNSEAAAWEPDGQGGYRMRALGMLPGHTHSRAAAINDLGDIVGTSVRNQFGATVLFTAPGGLRDLSASFPDAPRAINNRRVVIGGSPTCKRFDLDTLVVEDLGLPQGSFVSAQGYAVNAGGQVAGFAGLATSTSCSWEAARYTDGIGWQVLSGCGTSNAVYDMNDRGDCVMKLNVAPYVRFEGLGTFTVESLISAPVGPWFVINGYGITINNARQMVVPARNNALNQAGPVLLTPQNGGTRQPDLGFAGPGPARLDVFGGDLASGTHAEVLLTGTLPHSAAWLVVGRTGNPTPILGGTLVPVPFDLSVGLVADAAGAAALRIDGGGGPAALFAQCVCADAEVASGIGFSNAVRLDFRR